MNHGDTFLSGLDTLRTRPDRKVSPWFIYVPSLLLFVYILLRAKLVALNWDEAFTFFEFVRHPKWTPHDFNYMSANNHLLNTWLMKCSVTFFGESELALRLPNVLAGGVFFFYVTKLLAKICAKPWQLFAGFCLVALNPFLLDFFSMARGYGLSLGLLAAALFYLVQSVEAEFKIKHALLAQLLLAIAILANLTLIIFLVAVTGVLLLLVWRRGKIIQLLLLLPLPALLLIFLWPYYHQLKTVGAFFYGEEVQTFRSWLDSLATPMAYTLSWTQPYLRTLLAIFFCLPFFYTLYRLRKLFSAPSSRIATILCLPFALVIAGSFLQHYLLGTNLLAGRTALFFFPLAAFSWIVALKEEERKVSNILLGFSSAVFLLLFLFTMNTHLFIDFREQADVKAAMQKIKEQNVTAEEPLFARSIRTDLPYDLPMNYYRMRFGLDQFSHILRKENIEGESWFYDVCDSAKLPAGLQLVQYFPSTHTALCRPATPAHFRNRAEVWQDFEHEDPYRELLRDTLFLGDQGTFADAPHEYSIGVPIAVADSIREKVSAVTVSCRLRYTTRNTSALLMFVFTNEKEEVIETMHFTELSVKAGEWSVTGWTRPLPAHTKKVRVFLWNRDKARVYMDNVAIRLLEKV